MALQQLFFPSLKPDAEAEPSGGRSSTFADNMKLPIHRWYRYTAGFSADWVASVIDGARANGEVRVLDPFAGSGTVPLQAKLDGVDAYGIESNPYVYRIANAKLSALDFGEGGIRNICRKVLDAAHDVDPGSVRHSDLVERCFPPETLKKLDSLKIACQDVADAGMRDFVWFVITSILRTTSPVGTAQWQYIQPRKTKARTEDPYIAFERKVEEIVADVSWGKRRHPKGAHVSVVLDDARSPHSIPDGWANLVVTSPPYANNYDYADAMRLEMLFWGDIDGWRDLQTKVSSRLVRACTQHVASLRDSVAQIIDSDELAPISGELKTKYDELVAVREEHGGKKNYHLMIAAYFYDLARVFRSLHRLTTPDCRMCFVIGDSAPYGVHIPVERWLGELALSAGFRCYRFEKLRDRNVKWKNRKHRVPLKEGRLWIER